MSCLLFFFFFFLLTDSWFSSLLLWDVRGDFLEGDGSASLRRVQEEVESDLPF